MPGNPPSFSSPPPPFRLFWARVKQAKTADTSTYRLTCGHAAAAEEECARLRLRLAHRGIATTALWVNWGSGCLIPVKSGVKSNNHSALNGTDYDGWSVNLFLAGLREESEGEKKRKRPTLQLFRQLLRKDC